MTKRARIWIPILLALGLGCAKHVNAPAPRANLPPLVLVVSPPARATHVRTDVAIWAEFDRDLDPTTVDARHVHLKVDTRRLPITITYDAATRRIRIDTGGNLGLNLTHTVELEPGLRTADGDSLGQLYFWQFTTMSVRPAHAPAPDDGATGESPFAELQWQGTEESAGPIHYQVFFGTDSAAVANHTVLPTATTDTRFRPFSRWAQDVPDFWSVRTINFGTGESIDGPVWRFDPLPSTTPIDSMTIGLASWFYGYVSNPQPFYIYRVNCNPTLIFVGGVYDNLERWDLTSLSPSIRMAGATMDLMPTGTYLDGDSHGVQVFSVRSTGTVCTVNGPNPPVIPASSGPALAVASVLANKHLALESDALSAAVEAMIRQGEVNALMLKAGTEDHLASTSSFMTIRFYRPSSPALAAKGSRRPSSSP
ncbi:MAG TPA: Ig-like domain-containing protein [Candidatus Udaeobacter sp.]|jgi:hypothetical protein|nr:Ig-like domain-containing protein [Candidatus Udaeobacter sp.]